MSIFNRTPNAKPAVAPAATPTGALAGLQALAAQRAARTAQTEASTPTPEPIRAEALITGPEALSFSADPAPVAKRGRGRPRKDAAPVAPAGASAPAVDPFAASRAHQAPMTAIAELERLREAQGSTPTPDPEFQVAAPAPSAAPARVQNAAAQAMAAVTPNPADPKPVGLLLIDCTPLVGGSLPRAEEILENLAAQYQAEMGHPWEAAPFREGSGAMMQGLRAHLAAHPTNLAIRSGGPLATLAIEVLIPLAHQVIQGQGR